MTVASKCRVTFWQRYRDPETNNCRYQRTGLWGSRLSSGVNGIREHFRGQEVGGGVRRGEGGGALHFCNTLYLYSSRENYSTHFRKL